MQLTIKVAWVTATEGYKAYADINTFTTKKMTVTLERDGRYEHCGKKTKVFFFMLTNIYSF